MIFNPFQNMSTRAKRMTLASVMILTSIFKTQVCSLAIERSNNERAELRVCRDLDQSGLGGAGCLMSAEAEKESEELHSKASADMIEGVIQALLGLWILYEAFLNRNDEDT